LSNTVFHHYYDVITIFNKCFELKYNTKLLKGDDEPIYLPATEDCPHHSIFFAHGFFSSALHECSHWLIAGSARRELIDYGYWYMPDGRTATQQKLFQQAEVKPQAIEWILSKAANYRFRLSIDNLNGDESNTDEFREAIYQQIQYYCEQGLSSRANAFRRELCRFYGTPEDLHIQQFATEELCAFS
jgi:elongation factor P hydroxylase